MLQTFLQSYFVEKNEMAKQQAQDKKPKTFVLLDGSVTTYGFRVLVDGVDTSQFERNPVMFYNHKDHSLPIGTWTNIRKEDGKILADAVFDYEDTDPEVQRIIGKVERDIIKMCSVGLRDNEWSDDDIYKIDTQTLPTVIKSRLREASIATIGGNHNALRLYDQDGLEIDLSDEIKLTDFIKPLNNKKVMSEELLKLLNLSDKSDDKAVYAAVVALQDSNKTLTTEKEALQKKIDEINLADKEGKKNAFVAKVEQAVKDSRLNAAGKDHLVKLYDSNPEAAESFLDTIPARQPVYQQIINATQQNATELADLESKSWDELDRSGKLVLLKDSYPEVYKTKFKTKFGKEPEV